MFKLKTFALAGLVALTTSMPSGPGARAQVMQIGDIIMGGWTYCPRGTIAAAGQLLAVSSNDALFSLYGTLYGGDGRTTFGVPDLRGRSPLHFGAGPGLSPIAMAAKGGAETATMTNSTLAAHSHEFQADGAGQLVGGSATASSTTPLNQAFAVAPTNQYGSPPNLPMAAGTASVSLDGNTTSGVGGGQSFGLRDPFETIQICIVAFGDYPIRD